MGLQSGLIPMLTGWVQWCTTTVDPAAGCKCISSFVGTVPEGHPGRFPQLRRGQGQCTLWAHTSDRQHYSSCKGILSSSSPSRSTPTPPTSYCSLEPNLGASTPTTGEQTLPLTGMWQPQSKEEALFNIQCSCRHCNINHTPCQENNSQHTLRKADECIHTMNSPHIKNIRLMQATQGWSPHKNSSSRPQ